MSDETTAPWGPPTVERRGPSVGDVVGPWVLERHLGTGGCAQVYVARSASVSRAAVKVMRPEFLSSQHMVRRFLREAESLSRVQHPHVVRILDFGQHGQGVYIAMDLLVGTDARRLARDAPLPTAELDAFFTPLCAAVEATHAAGIVHRDLKLANVFLDEREGVKLLDFGIAKVEGGEQLTLRSQQLGTPATMAPEQLSGQPVDARTDVFGLGVMLYQLVTGCLPFAPARSERDAVTPPRDLAPVSAPLEAVVLRCLARQPAARFESVAALREALAAALVVPTPATQHAACVEVSCRAFDELMLALDGALVLEHARRRAEEAGFTVVARDARRLVAARRLEGPPAQWRTARVDAGRLCETLTTALPHVGTGATPVEVRGAVRRWEDRALPLAGTPRVAPALLK